MRTDNLDHLVHLTACLDVFQGSQEFLDFVVLKIYKDLLVEFYGCHGEFNHQVLLYEEDIDFMLLHTTIGVFGYTQLELTSPEFLQLVTSYVRNIGIIYTKFKEVCNNPKKRDILTTILKLTDLNVSVI